ncbi:hypothetical protein Salat_2391300 [Sesamum alatum]|uniref:Uncharacterized protein n=1 Tax=Sesamum alatum TaxID=300844 RepID=A0AAE1XXH1_9LAMI|nr:hypothetical protein Salat_2391300 [Sesamum alatum]
MSTLLTQNQCAENVNTVNWPPTPPNDSDCKYRVRTTAEWDQNTSREQQRSRTSATARRTGASANHATGTRRAAFLEERRNPSPISSATHPRNPSPISGGASSSPLVRPPIDVLERHRRGAALVRRAMADVHDAAIREAVLFVGDTAIGRRWCLFATAAVHERCSNPIHPPFVLCICDYPITTVRRCGWPLTTKPFESPLAPITAA